MNIELFAGAVFFAIGSSVVTYFILSARMKSLSTRDGVDLTGLESRLSDLITELNHVANSHVHAVEDRREELRRVLEVANQTTRRINTLISDLEILEKRIRRESDPVRPATPVRDDEFEADEIVKSLDARKPLRREALEERRRIAAEIADLSGSGLSPEAIAMRLEMPQNAVEMLLRRSRSGEV